MLDARYEDGHSAIEARLTERLGDAGRRIHTGRSRNDQVLVATRLWLKEKLARTQALCAEAAAIALQRAEVESDVPLPGYTHLQRRCVSIAFGGRVGRSLSRRAERRDTLRGSKAIRSGSAEVTASNRDRPRHATQRSAWR